MRTSTPRLAAVGRCRRAAAIRATLLAFALLGAGAAGALPENALSAGAALAGQWVQASCNNPDLTPASNQGWSSFITGTPGPESENDTNCSPTTPMEALFEANSVPVGTAETLQYTPPAGSTLAGGTLRVSLATTGDFPGTTGQAIISSPTDADDASDTIFECSGTTTCNSTGTSTYTGIIQIPANRGGNLYLTADCAGAPGQDCNAAGLFDVANIKLDYADLLLTNTSSPAASAFSGSLLSPNTHGTADIAFTATDPDGPGVYQVTIEIDGNTLYQATPNTNDGECDSVGFDSTWNALFFDWQQPCPQTEAVDIPINTTTLSDGPHDLKVIVVDAAENTSTVLDQTITTLNHPATGATPNTPTPTPTTPAGPPKYRLSLDRAAKPLLRGIARSFSRSAVQLSGVLKASADRARSGVVVTLWERSANGGAFRRLDQVTTGKSGTWTLRAPRGPSRLLRVVAGRTRPTRPGNKINVHEAVAPTLSFEVAAPGSRRLVFTGRLTISPLGTPPPLVLIETPGPDGWETVGIPVRVDPHGAYRYVYRSSPITSGRRFMFRAISPATDLWAQAVSPVRATAVH